MFENPRAMFDSSALWIGCGVIQPGDARVHDGTRTHGAGLKGDPQIAIGEPLAAKLLRCVPYRQYFGVRGRVVKIASPVVPLGDDNAPVDDHGGNGDFSRNLRPARQVERPIHMW